MDPKIIDEILDDLLPIFQNLETQNAAIIQLIKDKKIATDDELAPYLEQAGKASSVLGVALRARMTRLLASLGKDAEKTPENNAEKSEKRVETRTEKMPQKDADKTPDDQAVPATGEAQQREPKDQKLTVETQPSAAGQNDPEKPREKAA